MRWQIALVFLVSFFMLATAQIDETSTSPQDNADQGQVEEDTDSPSRTSSTSLIKNRTYAATGEPAGRTFTTQTKPTNTARRGEATTAVETTTGVSKGSDPGSESDQEDERVNRQNVEASEENASEKSTGEGSLEQQTGGTASEQSVEESGQDSPTEGNQRVDEPQKDVPAEDPPSQGTGQGDVAPEQGRGDVVPEQGQGDAVPEQGQGDAVPEQGVTSDGTAVGEDGPAPTGPDGAILGAATRAVDKRLSCTAAIPTDTNGPIVSNPRGAVQSGSARIPSRSQCGLGSGREKEEQTQDDKSAGICKKGEKPDPAEGPQDANTKNPKCIPDDSSKCGPGEVATTRAKDSKEDAKCVKDSGDDPKCGKNEYVSVTAVKGADGDTARKKCKKNRRFMERKQQQFKDFWEDRKKKFTEAKKRKEEEDKRKKEEDDRKKQQQEEDDRKKKADDDDKKEKQRGRDCMLAAAASNKDGEGTYFALDYFSDQWLFENVRGYMDGIKPNLDGDVLSQDSFQKYADCAPMEAFPIGKRTPGRFKFKIPGLGSNLVLGRAESAVDRVKSLFKEGGPRNAPAGKSRNDGDQKKGADQITKNPNWKRCLKGEAPQKV